LVPSLEGLLTLALPPPLVLDVIGDALELVSRPIRKKRF